LIAADDHQSGQGEHGRPVFEHELHTEIPAEGRLGRE
jgi:hypothetical protein